VTTNSPARANVLYVGGWGRSGSTLLDRLLGQVPDTFSVGEMRDIWLRGVLENRRCGCGEPFGECPFWTEVGAHAFGGWTQAQARRLHGLRMRFDRPWTTPLLAGRSLETSDLREYVQVTAALYGAIAEISGANTIVDSTKIPSYAFLLRRIPTVDLRFLHLVRDSRGVVYSWQKSVTRTDSTGDADDMIRYGVASASGRYLMYNGLSGLFSMTSTPYLFIRYEDLATDPEPTIRRVLRFAGLPGSVDFLQQGTADLSTNHTVDGNPMRFSDGPLRVRLDEAWREQLAPASRAGVTVLTAPLLLRYGYDLRSRGHKT
jgi:hypothetical protein